MSETKRIVTAGDTITIPENTRVIIEGGVVVFESTEPSRELNSWYSENGIHQMIMLNLGQGKCVGFVEGQWMECLRMVDELNWQPADMTKVKEFLIKEAEKKYPKGTRFKTPWAEMVKMSNGEFHNHGSNGCLYSNTMDLVFSKKGKWAEIIKKPLYVNQYGTEFFKGDKHWAIMDGKIEGPYGEESSFKPNSISTGALTERECHRYLADNWDELKTK